MKTTKILDALQQKIDIQGDSLLYLDGELSSSRPGVKPIYITVDDMISNIQRAKTRIAELAQATENMITLADQAISDGKSTLQPEKNKKQKHASMPTP